MQACNRLAWEFSLQPQRSEYALPPSALQSPDAGYCRDGSCSLAEDVIQ